MATDDGQREMERYLAHFNRASKRPSILFTPRTQPSWTPSVDVYETDSAIVVLLDLAGIDPDMTEVQADGHALIVRGERTPRHAGLAAGAERSYHALEIPYGRFERRLWLPSGADTSAASAAYRDGLLEITVPKTVPRKVKIATDEPSRGAGA